MLRGNSNANSDALFELITAAAKITVTSALSAAVL